MRCITAYLTHYLLLMFLLRHWENELERKNSDCQPRLLVALVKCLWWRLLLHGLMYSVEVSMCNVCVCARACACVCVWLGMCMVGCVVGWVYVCVCLCVCVSVFLCARALLYLCHTSYKSVSYNIYTYMQISFRFMIAL